MAELQFAKTFLAALDSRPIKLPADYVEDPRGYPARPPYILPRMPRPLRKSTDAAPASGSPASTVPGQELSASISVRSLHRNPNPLDVEDVAGRPLPLATTSLLDVRTLLAERSGVPLNKLRLLYQKKPVTDSKVLQDLVGADATATTKSPLKIELGVMVVGGAATVAAAAAAAEAATAKDTTAAATEAKGAATATEPMDAAQSPAKPTGVESPAFWDDLRGFLVQRLPDSKQADEAFSLFLRAWENRED